MTPSHYKCWVLTNLTCWDTYCITTKCLIPRNHPESQLKESVAIRHDPKHHGCIVWNLNTHLQHATQNISINRSKLYRKQHITSLQKGAPTDQYTPVCPGHTLPRKAGLSPFKNLSPSEYHSVTGVIDSNMQELISKHNGFETFDSFNFRLEHTAVLHLKQPWCEISNPWNTISFERLL